MNISHRMSQSLCYHITTFVCTVVLSILIKHYFYENGTILLGTVVRYSIYCYNMYTILTILVFSQVLKYAFFLTKTFFFNVAYIIAQEQKTFLKNCMYIAIEQVTRQIYYYFFYFFNNISIFSLVGNCTHSSVQVRVP